MRTALLLGSGVSILGKVPGVAEITERVLTGDKIYAHTDGNFYFGTETPRNEEIVAILVEFAKILNGEMKRYLNGERDANYEDLFYLASQIRDEEEMELDSPAVKHFADAMCKKADEQSLPWKNHYSVNSIHKLAKRTAAYVTCVAWKSIQQVDSDCNPSSFLKCLADLASDTKIDIYTLNHDRLIEKLFKPESISFTDGFDRPNGTLRYWNPTLLDDEGFDVRLFKLHGGIDWFQFQSSDTPESWRSRSVAIPTDYDYEHAKSDAGIRVECTESRPLILIGTFNKLITYNYGVFGDLISRFHLNLDRYSQLLVSGYGFGDKGINNRLLDWLWLEDCRRIVLVEPDTEGLKKRARNAVRGHWDELIRLRKLRIIERGVQDVTAEEVERAFG